MKIPGRQFRRFSELVYHECGISLHDGKQQLLQARLAKRLIARLKNKEHKMNVFPRFIMRVAKATSPPEKGTGVMSIIIRRPYAYLKNELCSTFEGKEDVKVIVDRRYGERRTRTQSVELERRRTDLRGPKEELVEVLLSA